MRVTRESPVLAQRARKRKTGSLVVLLLAERDTRELSDGETVGGVRSTRAVEDQPGSPV
jgi:hypothetical protein